MAVLQRLHRPAALDHGPSRLQDPLPLNSLEHDEASHDVAGDQVQRVPLLEVVGQGPRHRRVVAAVRLPPPEQEARRHGQAPAEQAASVAPHLLGELVVLVAVVLRHVVDVVGERRRRGWGALLLLLLGPCYCSSRSYHLRLTGE